MLEKVTAYMNAHHMAEKGDHIIAGVSGGADSVCLFLILLSMKEKAGFTFSVVHVEHGIRGKESQEDAEFVKNLCEETNTEFTCVRADVPLAAKERKMSEEEAGRIVRYAAFEEACKKYEKEAKARGGKVKIAVAHHANDAAETMLLHLCRGCGPEGLVGILPVREKIIRPLLCLSREEIEQYLNKMGMEYRNDETNGQLYYARNRIRMEAVPALVKVNSKAVEHMNGAAAKMRSLMSFIDIERAEAFRKCVSKDGADFLCNVEKWLRYHEFIRSEVIKSLLEQAAGSRKDIGGIHVESVTALAFSQTGKQICLPYGLCACKEYEAIRIMRQEYKIRAEDKNTGGELAYGYIEGGLETKNAGGSVITPFGTVEWYIIEAEGKYEEIPKKQYTKWLDYDMIKSRLCIRTRGTGDYFCIDSMGHRQKLKGYFINEKVPGQVRDKVLLFAEGTHVAWAAGYRISAAYRITGNTRRILEIRLWRKDNE